MSEQTDKLTDTVRTLRRALRALCEGDTDQAAELLDELDAADPLAVPLSMPPESYTDFFADYRRAQTDQGADNG